MKLCAFRISSSAFALFSDTLISHGTVSRRINLTHRPSHSLFLSFSLSASATVPSSSSARTRIRRFVFARTCIAISNRLPRRLWYSKRRQDSVSRLAFWNSSRSPRWRSWFHTSDGRRAFAIYLELSENVGISSLTKSRLVMNIWTLHRIIFFRKYNMLPNFLWKTIAHVLKKCNSKKEK